MVSLLVSSLSWVQINQQKYAEYAGIADSMFKVKKYNEAADNYTTAFSYYEWKATPNHRYQDNLFKVFRVDFVASYKVREKLVPQVRIGVKKMI